MENLSRDTLEDKLANFATDTNRVPSINNYLIKKIKVTPIYNMIRRTVNSLSKHRGTNKFTNTSKFTNRFSNNFTDKFI